MDIFMRAAFDKWAAYYKYCVFIKEDKDALSWPEWKRYYNAGLIV